MTNQQAWHARGITPFAATIALLVFVVALWLRVVALGRGGFWLDEIYSASFANLSALGTVVAAFLYDPHPPLYYLQLNAWGRLGHGDLWLLLNSVSWSAATLLAVFLGTSRRFGSISGLIALCFCAVMGSEVFFADELRMYAMYGCLSVLSWIAVNRLRSDYRFRAAVPLIVILAIMGAIHSASILGASAALLFALPEGNRQQIRRQLPTWVAIAAIVACTYLPWAVNASFRHVAHTAPPTLQSASHTIAGWIIGYGNAPLPAWAGPVTTIVVAVALIAIALTRPLLSRLVVCFIAWPLLFGAALSIAGPADLARSHLRVLWALRGHRLRGCDRRYSDQTQRRKQQGSTVFRHRAGRSGDCQRRLACLRAGNHTRTSRTITASSPGI